MATVVRSGLRLDRDRNPGRGDRHRVNVSPTLPRQRMPQPPALRLQRRERTLHLVLRASTDAATTGEREPVASVEAEPERGEEQQPGERRRSRARRQPARAAPRRRSPPPPGRRATDAGTAVDARSSTDVLTRSADLPVARLAERSTHVPPRRPPRRAIQAAYPAAATSPGGSPRAPWSLASSRAAHRGERAIPTAIDSRHAASATAGGPPRPGPSASRPLSGPSGSRRPYQPSATTRSARRLKRRRKSGIAIRRDDATQRCSHPAWTTPAAIPGRLSSSRRDSPLRTQYLAPIATSETPSMYTPKERSASNPSHAAEPAAVGDRALKWTCVLSFRPGEDRRHRFASSSDS